MERAAATEDARLQSQELFDFERQKRCFRTLLVGVGCRGHLPITTSYRFASAHLLSSFQNFVSAAMRIAWKRRLDDTWDRQNLLEAKSGFEPVDADEGKCPDGK